MGLTQPLIGTFDLPIGDLMIEKIQSQKDEVEDMQKLLDKLENLIKSDVNQSIKAFDQAKDIPMIQGEESSFDVADNLM